MLYYNGEHKGSNYGFAAISLLKEKYPDMKAYLFGAPERPAKLPSWIKYIHNIVLPSSTIHLHNSLHLVKLSSVPIKHYLLILPSLQPLATTILLSVSMILTTLSTSCK